MYILYPPRSAVTSVKWAGPVLVDWFGTLSSKNGDQSRFTDVVESPEGSALCRFKDLETLCTEQQSNFGNSASHEIYSQSSVNPYGKRIPDYPWTRLARFKVSFVRVGLRSIGICKGPQKLPHMSPPQMLYESLTTEAKQGIACYYCHSNQST